MLSRECAAIVTVLAMADCCYRICTRFHGPSYIFPEVVTRRSQGGLNIYENVCGESSSL